MHWTHELHKQHPARVMDFDNLYNGLVQHADEGFISISKGEDELEGLEIFTYTPNCVGDKAWNSYTALARGLILHPESNSVVATPFPKFWNHGELDVPMPDEDFTVFEKLDGSMGTAFHWNGYWHVATKGSFYSDQAQWATKWLRSHHKCTNKMQQGYTYLFEIIYPENRIVVDYEGRSGLFLLESYDDKGFSLGQDGHDAHGKGITLDELATYLGVSHALYWNHFEDVDHVKNHFNSLDYNHEGGVVRYDSGFRMKIKGEEYLRMHRIISHCSPLNIWSMIVAGDDLDEFRKEIPEEFHTDFDKIRELLEGQLEENMSLLSEWHEKTKDLSDKEVGLMLKDIDSDIVRSFIFPWRKKGLKGIMQEKDLSKLSNADLFTRERFLRSIRPTSNNLEGYTPSMMSGMFDS